MPRLYETQVDNFAKLKLKPLGFSLFAKVCQIMYRYVQNLLMQLLLQ